MKPLVRWIVGNASLEGIDCLLHSIREWERVYGDQFDKLVCFNGEPPSQLLKANVELLNQKDYLHTLPIEPEDTFWKFCPPRVRPESHEIILDNDLVIYKNPPEISGFLDSDRDVIVSAAHKHFYGQFETILEPGILVNTGLIGLPPNFDLESKLKMVLKLYPFMSLKEHCDDQGAFICATRNRLKIIPMEQIHVCNPRTDFAHYKLGTHGTHFAGLNQGYTQFWERYDEETTHRSRTDTH